MLDGGLNAFREEVCYSQSVNTALARIKEQSVCNITQITRHNSASALRRRETKMPLI